MRDLTGADTVLCICVTASTAATVGHRIIQLCVGIPGASRNAGSSVHQGERHTATLDHESPPKPPPQISVLKKEETELKLFYIHIKYSYMTHRLFIYFAEHMSSFHVPHVDFKMRV